MSDNLIKAEERMLKAIENLESNLKTIRTGRASSQILERVQVDYYGSMMPINQLSSIQVVEGTQLVVKPYDRSIIKSVGHAIQAANLGLNPQVEADVIRILVPQLTQERREQLAKDAQKYGEEAKVAIRNIRRDAIDEYKKQQKNSEITEDDLRSAEKDIQDLTDKSIKELDKIAGDKEKELLEV